MIKQPEEMTFTDKKFSVILYGSPGVGKTTLALSAPDPILVDFDRGISRVKAQHRKTTIMCDTYEDILNDMASPEVASCQTIIIDTGGSFVSFLQDWAMRTNPAINKQKNGAISLKGFGAVKSEFNRFTSHVKDVMNKNIIYVFHSQERTDKDGNAQQRLMCEGAAKNTVWTPCDFGGFVQIIGNDRVVCFSPEQEFFAKGCHGITGRYSIPQLNTADKNDFLTRLFEQAKANIAAENDVFIPQKEQYNTVMSQVKSIIGGVTNIESANVAWKQIPALEHALTSKKEAAAMLKAKTTELGLKYTREGYVAKEAN